MLISSVIPQTLVAQELHQDIQGVWRARVTAIWDTRVETVPGSDVTQMVQTLEVEILEGEQEGEQVIFDNDFILLEEGDAFFMNYLVTIDGTEIYSVREVDRRVPMFLLLLLFIAVVIIFGGKQGVRSLLSLVGSLFVVGYVLVPGLVGGISPLILSIGVAAGVLFFAIFVTHGFNRRSLIAYGGTMTAVLLSGVLAYISVHGTGLTGFSSDESIYLNLSTGGSLDFVGLLLGAIIIGALGALDDIAVTQVAVVRELYHANKSLSVREVYTKALRVGKEHVGALVNTLVLAYTGAALPLLLLFAGSEASVLTILNREIFATEIVRMIVGSIGLILTVPITTLAAAYFVDKDDVDDDGHVHVCAHAGHNH